MVVVLEVPVPGAGGRHVVAAVLPPEGCDGPSADAPTVFYESGLGSGIESLPRWRRKQKMKKAAASSPASWSHTDPVAAGVAKAAAGRHHDAAVQVVVVARPGYSGSEPVLWRALKDRPAELAAVADALDLTRKFSVAGFSSGGLYALAAAAHPSTAHRVADVHLLSADGAWALWPWHTFNMVHMLAWLLTHSPVQLLLACLLHLLLMVVPKGGTLAKFLGRAAAVIEEARIERSAWDLPVSLRDIACPVHVYHGDKDVLVALSAARHMCQVLPNAHLHVQQGQTHFMLKHVWPLVLDQAGAAAHGEQPDTNTSAKGQASSARPPHLAAAAPRMWMTRAATCVFLAWVLALKDLWFLEP